MTQEEYWFWICNIDGLYQKGISRLLEVFDNPAEIFRSSEETLVKSGRVDARLAHEIVLSKGSLRDMYKLDKIRKDGITFIYYGGKNYPEAFMNLTDKPYSLYVKGKLPDPDIPSAGIVGSRTCSGYGREMAMKYSQVLAAGGIQIISGMAVGVDSHASRAAIEVGGKTFVVLGSGIDVIYPPENIELYYQIILNGGGVISEYPVHSAPLPWQFPHRNRLISALSDKLLIIEARKRSGTLTTAAYALSQGKDVYALPGRVTDPLSEGCNRMIADGAGVLLNPSYILEEFYGRIKPAVNTENNEKNMGSQDMETVYRKLSYEPKIIEEIAYECRKPVEETAAILTEMELIGMCVQTSKDYYSRG